MHDEQQHQRIASICEHAALRHVVGWSTRRRQGAVFLLDSDGSLRRQCGRALP